MTGPKAFAVIAAVAAFGFGAGAGADDIVLRTSVTPPEAWVGQRARFNIEVLGADGWAQISQMGQLELSGAWVMRTETQGVRLSETIGRTSYTGQRYQLSIYCQRPGRVVIPALPVTVTVKQWGFKTGENRYERTTPATELMCKVPPGAEGIRGLISTTRLEAEQAWSSRPNTVAPGDAVTRTIRLSAVDVSGMAFPPIQHPKLDGVSLYPGEPAVSDETDRGSLRGRREESVTYVFEQPGRVVLPDLVLPWWNTDAARLERFELPGLDLEVVGEAVAEEPVAETTAEQVGPPRDRVPTAVLIAPVAALGLWLSVWLLRRIRRWRIARRQSEPAHFKHVRKALPSGDPATIAAAIMGWLDRIDTGVKPARLDLFLDEYGDDAARQAAAALTRSLAANRAFGEWRALGSGLAAARHELFGRRRRRRLASRVLPELNG